MKIASLVFLLGCGTLYLFSSLPPLWPCFMALALCALIGAVIYFPSSVATRHLLPGGEGFPPGGLVLRVIGIIAIFILGMIWVIFRSQQVLSWTLPEAWDGQAAEVEGTIVSIPVIEERAVHFVLQLDKFAGKPVKTKIKLSWYSNKNEPLPSFSVGDSWKFVVRLKPPHNLQNPGSYDEQKFLFSHGIRATGYIVSSQPIQLLKNRPSSRWIDRQRQKILRHLQASLADKPYAAFVYALTVGEKFAITAEEWQVFQNTGTNHLMAIAGLHIGFVAGLVFLMMSFIWRYIPRAPLLLPAPLAAAIASLIAGIIYSALAGFDIPTQRAVLMLSVFLLGILGRRYIGPWHSIALALIVVLLWNPLSVLEVGFWLSFGAVFLLAYGLSGRFNTKTFWWKHGRTQWVVSLGLIPLTLLFFSNASLVSFIANSIAIPWVGFITVPLSLLGGLLSLVWPWAAHYVLIFAEWTLHGVWPILELLSKQPGFAWQHITQQTSWMFVGIIGFLLLLAPRGLPNRWLGAFFLAPMCFAMPAKPAMNDVWFTLLDVGQGLSAVVQTHEHVLIFDAGPKLSESYDMGRAVVIPFLRYQGITKIDKLVISHGDNDHIGGSQAILNTFPVSDVQTSVPERFPEGRANFCLRGQRWQWDGVDFQFLYPAKENLGLDNNSSCVLKISSGQQQILLTGDIEKEAEKILLIHPNELSSTLIIAPHHGSNTSSTLPFLKAVQPKTVLFPTGYLNRFGFPKPEIVIRYRDLGAVGYDTAEEGAILFKISANTQELKPTLFVVHRKQVWL